MIKNNFVVDPDQKQKLGIEKPRKRPISNFPTSADNELEIEVEAKTEPPSLA